jgi:C1A family cysteine protease/putative hemolysin
MQLQHKLHRTSILIFLVVALLASLTALFLLPSPAVHLPAASPFRSGAVAFQRGYLISLSQPGANPYLTMRNPADVYCIEMGYQYQIITEADGSQSSICVLPDKSTCPSWDFLNGKCGQAYSFCAQNGMSTLTMSDGNNPFSAEYAVCVDSNGVQRGSVSTLSGLLEEASGRTAEDWLNEPAAPTLAEPEAAQEDTALPTSFDWRDYNGGNWLTSVKNQGICGSCWAFSAVGVAEAVTNIASSNAALDPDLSEEYLVTDCSSAGDCAGGLENLALKYIRDSGIPDEACLPYNDGLSTGCTYISSTGACDASKCTYASSTQCSDYTCSDRCSNYASRLTKIASYTYVGYNQAKNTIKQALVDHGPLTVAMNMSGSFSGGIYTCTSTSQNHAVVLAGYNDSGSYWIVKNSWGSTWGPEGNGYFKVAYDQCGIQLTPYYATGISVSNPVPSLTSLDPNSKTAGGSAFTLTVNGTNFKNGVSTVRWKGSNRTTTYISSTQLQASILASDIASAGTASVTVFNSSPGGGTSNALTFTIKASYHSFVPFLFVPAMTGSGVVNGDFESGAGVGWTSYSLNNYTVILSSANLGINPHAGSWAAWMGGAQNETASISQAVTVPGSTPYLTYWYYTSSNDHCNYDFAYVYVNSTIVTTYNLCKNQATNGWVQDSLDLSSYAGSSVTIKYLAETDSSLVSNFYLDDVAFSASAP